MGTPLKNSVPPGAQEGEEVTYYVNVYTSTSVLFPQEGKGLVTFERFLGCAESAFM